MLGPSNHPGFPFPASSGHAQPRERTVESTTNSFSAAQPVSRGVVTRRHPRRSSPRSTIESGSMMPTTDDSLAGSDRTFTQVVALAKLRSPVLLPRPESGSGLGVAPAVTLVATRLGAGATTLGGGATRPAAGVALTVPVATTGTIVAGGSRVISGSRAAGRRGGGGSSASATLGTGAGLPDGTNRAMPRADTATTRAAAAPATHRGTPVGRCSVEHHRQLPRVRG